jgi:phage terminase small subunit
MRGRKPQPTALKALRATSADAKRLHTRSIAPLLPLGDPPEWLSDSQKQEWACAVENAPPGVLKRTDAAALAVYVIAADLLRKANESSNQEGLVSTAVFRILRERGLFALKAASELGFTPVSRARIETSNQSGASVGDWEDVAI